MAIGKNTTREAGNRPFYLQLWLNRLGQFELRYSSLEQGPYVKLFTITADQADWMHSDGWPIVRERE